MLERLESGMLRPTLFINLCAEGSFEEFKESSDIKGEAANLRLEGGKHLPTQLLEIFEI
ncbi:unnamed protein product [Ilex paraguariensis]|uniref:Uncharacterized protein n=1 Tax=Ilex paraguariensis TaxID=185542 RepID=A0ABC8RCM4_9AQUA